MNTITPTLFKENDFFFFFKNCERHGGGYCECGEGYDKDDSCRQGENLFFVFEIVCNEYNIEYEK